MTSAATTLLTGTTDAVKSGAKKLAEKVIDLIAGTARAKKHTQGGDFTVRDVSGDNNRVLTVKSLNIELPVDKGVLDLLRDGLINNDLGKMAFPLKQDAIVGFELLNVDEENPDLSLIATDRPYLTRFKATRTTKTRETELVGTLNTISKKNNSGSFITDAGKRIRYRFADDNLSGLYTQFAHLGLVMVRCIAKLDQNLDVVSITIRDVTPYRDTSLN